MDQIAEILTTIGAGAFSALLGAIAGAWLQARFTSSQSRRSYQLEALDSAERDLKDVSWRARREIFYPGWPRLEAVRPAHDFIYGVARASGNISATDEFFATLQKVWDINSSLLRVLGWRVSRIGLSERMALMQRLADAEGAVLRSLVEKRREIT